MQMYQWARLGWVGAIGVGGFVAWGALSLSPAQWQLATEIQFAQLIVASVDDWQWQWSRAISRLPAALFVLSLLPLIRFFRRVEQGEVFSMQTITCLRHFSRWLLISAGCSLLMTPLLSLLLSWQHPPGQRFLSIDVGVQVLNGLGLALLMWLIARILYEGLLIARENQEFV